MKKQQNTHPIDIYAIIENGGATLDKNGFEVNYLRGYQVSKHDIAILSRCASLLLSFTTARQPSFCRRCVGLIYYNHFDRFTLYAP